MTTLKLADHNIDTIPGANGATDYVVSDNIMGVLGLLTLRLEVMPNIRTIVLGSLVVPGTEAHYVGVTTKVVDGKVWALNSVYQFKATDICPEITDAQLGDWMRHAIGERSPFLGGTDSLTCLGVGEIVQTRVADKVHYMVGDILISQA
jgi:hypothetical protein